MVCNMHSYREWGAAQSRERWSSFQGDTGLKTEKAASQPHKHTPASSDRQQGESCCDLDWSKDLCMAVISPQRLIATPPSHLPRDTSSSPLNPHLPTDTKRHVVTQSPNNIFFDGFVGSFPWCVFTANWPLGCQRKQKWSYWKSRGKMWWKLTSQIKVLRSFPLN